MVEVLVLRFDDCNLEPPAEIVVLHPRAPDLVARLAFKGSV